MRPYLTYLFLLIFGVSWGQSVIPENNQTINYKQILFQINPVDFASTYEFNIDGIDGDFSQPIFQRIDSTHITIINGFEFGKEYKWKVAAYDEDHQLIHLSETFNFKIQNSVLVDTTNIRFRIIKSEKEFGENEVIFLDYNSVAINRKGEAVWFLPEVDRSIRNSRLRDLKMTPSGTITFLTPKSCREISLNSKSLWHTPTHDEAAKDSVDEFFHHEFTKTNRNTYLVLCKEFIDKTLTNGNQTINKIPISVIKEYNENGDIIWFWSSLDYITENDLLEVGGKVFMGNTFGHANSLSESIDGSKIYAGFRDLNAVLCIDKKSKKVITSYGDKIPSDTTKNAIGFFKKQHSAIPYDSDHLIVFNNNARGNVSSVVIFSEAFAKTESKINWEFQCDFDSIMPGNSDRMGNAQPLPSGNILVNMGSVARLFEVTPDKQIIWDCLPEQWSPDSLKWLPYSNYRLNRQSSLYPVYASISLKRNENRDSYVSVCNEGTNADQYDLVIRSKNGKILHTFSLTLNSNESYAYFPSKRIRKKAYSFVLTSTTSGKTFNHHFTNL